MNELASISADRPQLDEQGFTARIIDDASRIVRGNLSDRALERARHAVLDWLGVTIAGAQQPSSRAIHRVSLAEGGNPAAFAVGTSHRLTARQAALAGGVAGHALDFDDMGFGSHPSVIVLPAAFALAEETGADGATTVEAIVQGFELLDRIFIACGLSSYHRGFHTTGTFGAFAAAMTAGRILGLDRQKLQYALGIAGTQASGLKASFGTMSKHLNAGNAAAVGVLAARLSETGFTGATDILENPQGFVASHNKIEDFDPTRSGDGRLAVEKIMFKLHAACGGTHSSINGIRDIKARRPFAADEVEEIELLCSEQMPTVCGIPEPVTGVEAMFSVRYAATLALLDRETGPAAFTDEMVKDPELIAKRALIKVKTTPRIPTTGSPSEVTVRLKNGEELTACINALVVTPDDRLAAQWADLEAKFHGLVAPLLGEARSAELVAMVCGFETLPSIQVLSKAAAR